MKQYRTDPLTEREKAYLRRSKGIVLPHSAAVGPKPVDVPKARVSIAPVKSSYRPKRSRHGCRLSPENRAMVERRNEARAEFFASLGVRV